MPGNKKSALEKQLHKKQQKQTQTNTNTNTNTKLGSQHEEGVSCEAIGDFPEHRIKGQEWVVCTWCDGEHNSQVNGIGIRFGGAFATENEANKQAQQIHKKNSMFDVAVIRGHEWVTIPLRKDIEPFIRNHYDNEILDKIMKERMMQARRGKNEMDARISKERHAAEERLRKIHGPDYVMGVGKSKNGSASASASTDSTDSTDSTESVTSPTMEYSKKTARQVPEYREKVYFQPVKDALKEYINANIDRPMSMTTALELEMLLKENNIKYAQHIKETYGQ